MFSAVFDTRSKIFGGVLAFAAVLCLACPALAQEAPAEVAPEPEEGQERFAESTAEAGTQAMDLYQRSEVLYDEGRYEEAVGLLLQVLDLDPEAAELYYNIALVYEHLQDWDSCLDYLQRYLRFDIGDEETARVHRMMARVRGAREHVQQPVGPGETRVVVRRPGLADGWFWGMVGTTGAFALGAVITGVLALNWANAADDFTLGIDGDLAEHQRWVDVADSLAITTDVFIGLAAGAAVAGLLLFVLRDREVVEEGEAGTPADDGADDAGESDGSPSDNWGPPPEDSVSRAVDSRSSLLARLLPTVQVGVGAVMIGWEL